MASRRLQAVEAHVTAASGSATRPTEGMDVFISMDDGVRWVTATLPVNYAISLV